jgi:metal-responsive CopG/Arc/MetJ family transcriptional regulator
MKRAGKRPEGKLLMVWVSRSLLSRLDEGVKRGDSDRSKFVRNAIREKLAKHGVSIK